MDIPAPGTLRVVKQAPGSPTECANITDGTGWKVPCTRKVKTDITPLSAADYENILGQLNATTIYSYLRNDVPDMPEIGVIAEECPLFMASTNNGPENRAISQTRSIGFLTALAKLQNTRLTEQKNLIKQQNIEIDNLLSEINSLKQK
jgi:hypothetical protein